jgi:hypothetical protein
MLDLYVIMSSNIGKEIRKNQSSSPAQNEFQKLSFIPRDLTVSRMNIVTLLIIRGLLV